MDKSNFRFRTVNRKAFRCGVFRLVNYAAFLLLVLPIFTGCGVYSWNAKTRAKAHYKKASKLALDQNYDEAIKEYKEAIKEDHKLFEAYYDLGVVHTKRGEYEHAIRQYMLAATLRPGDSDCWAALARAYAKLGEYEAAIKQFDHAIELGDNSPQTQIDIGLAYEKLGKFDSAISHYEQALRLHLTNAAPTKMSKTNAQAYWNIGNVYYAQKDYEKARDFYHKAIETDPDYLDAYLNLGVLYEKNLNNKRLAVSNYKKYLELGGTLSRVHDWVDQLTQQIDSASVSPPSATDNSKRKEKGKQPSIQKRGKRDKGSLVEDKHKRADTILRGENNNVE